MNATEVLESLAENEIRERLRELDREQRALKVLLRAVCVRKPDRERDLGDAR